MTATAAPRVRAGPADELLGVERERNTNKLDFTGEQCRPRRSRGLSADLLCCSCLKMFQESIMTFYTPEESFGWLMGWLATPGERSFRCVKVLELTDSLIRDLGRSKSIWFVRTWSEMSVCVCDGGGGENRTVKPFTMIIRRNIRPSGVWP